MAELVLDAQKTALVAIDLQNALMGLPAAPYAVADVVAKNREIADALRAKGGTVVWIRVDVNKFLAVPADEPHRRGDQQVPAEMMEITPAAGRVESDLLITKPHWGAFAGTELEAELRARGIDTVVLTGVATNIGVESTLRQGSGLGFGFVTVSDACSGLSADDHAFAFEKIFPRISRVRTTDEVVNALA